MLKQEERSRKVAEWLTHLQGWKDSGRSLAAYAKDRGLALWAMYHWRGVLIREGRWCEPPKAADRSKAVRSAPSVRLRFARVAMTDVVRPAPVIVRGELSNGRRVQIEAVDLDQLAQILSVLERSA